MPETYRLPMRSFAAPAAVGAPEYVLTGPGSRPNTRGAVFAGAFAIGAFFVGFGGWAATAPLASGIVAQGVVSAESNRKTVQHLEGGIVRDILVKDGDPVTPGQVLVRLDDTQAGATLELLRSRKAATLALQARLEAQRDAREAIAFPTELTFHEADAGIADLMKAQTDTYATQRASLKGQVAILNERIANLKAEIGGIQGEVAAEDKQLQYVNEQIAAQQPLLAKNLIPKDQVVGLQRQAAEIDGRRSRARADVSRAQQDIGEVQLRIADLHKSVVTEAITQLGDVQSTLSDLAERLRAAEDITRRSEIVAQSAGTVVNLRLHTTGGVIAPGAAILDLVPADDRLVIEARVSPTDIDSVRPNQDAEVRITAFNQRHALPLRGRVIYVSADRLTDERNGVPYYSARIELLDDPATVTGNKRLDQGMPADVVIVTKARTLLDYLAEPLTAVFRRSMREG